MVLQTQADPGRWCTGLGVAPTVTSSGQIDHENGAPGAATIAAAANLSPGALSAVQLHFRPLKVIFGPLCVSVSVSVHVCRIYIHVSVLVAAGVCAGM